ncbi:DUF4178 domain-containing protein [Candidatus Uhrbacteria bacterium]|nr:DUF4178 domain-containing protein [Candidatus Uhrbacteria bacterium]
MNIKRLYKLDLGNVVTIFNEPFTYVGHSAIELDSGHRLRWLYDDEGRMLSVAPQDEELILFREIEDEIEPEDEMIMFQGKEYEFEYEDAGNVLESEGEALADADDRFLFSDYQTKGGEIVRLVENESTGESTAYVGVYVSDEDISEM